MSTNDPKSAAPPARARLGRDIFVALSLKIMLLAILYGLFFSPSHRPPADAAAIATALVGSDRH